MVITNPSSENILSMVVAGREMSTGLWIVLMTPFSTSIHLHGDKAVSAIMQNCLKLLSWWECHCADAHGLEVVSMPHFCINSPSEKVNSYHSHLTTNYWSPCPRVSWRLYYDIDSAVQSYGYSCLTYPNSSPKLIKVFRCYSLETTCNRRIVSRNKELFKYHGFWVGPLPPTPPLWSRVIICTNIDCLVLEYFINMVFI